MLVSRYNGDERTQKPSYHMKGAVGWKLTFDDVDEWETIAVLVIEDLNFRVVMELPLKDVGNVEETFQAFVGAIEKQLADEE